jgi:prepilin-type N-terminal cleavage/methylation domain-containing protein
MRDDAGFTLLEVVIAFAVAALALGALYEGSTAGIRATAIANHYEAALSRARSRLAAAGNPALLNAGESSGDDGGGYTWRLLVSRVASAPIAGAPPETAPSDARHNAVRNDWRCSPLTLRNCDQAMTLLTKALSQLPSLFPSSAWPPRVRPPGQVRLGERNWSPSSPCFQNC